MQRFPRDHLADFVARQRFVFQQALGQTFEIVRLFGQHAVSRVIAFVDQTLHFGLDQRLGIGRYREARRVALIAFMRFGIVDVADSIRHAPAHHHGPCQGAGLLNIARRSRRYAFGTILDDFGGLAGHRHRDLLLAFILVHVQPVHFGQADDHAQGTAARDDRGFVDRIAFGHVHADNGVTGLVIGGLFLLIGGQHHRPALGPHHHLVLGAFEIVHRDKAPAHARRRQRRLVHQVHQIGPRKARRAARDHAQVNVGAQRHLAGVHVQDLLAPLDVGVRHMDRAVKAARAQQRRVQHVLAVGRSDDDHTLVRLEPVHLDQKLVQSLLALVIAAADAHATGAAHGIDLVDEDDAGRVLLGLFEHVADPACANADEHFHKVRPRDGEERHASLAGDGAGQQGFTGTRRADQKGALGDLAAKAAEFLRIAQEFYDFLKLFLGFVDACDIIEGHAAMLFRQQFGARFAKAHGPAAPAALHAVHEENPDADQHKERQPQRDQREEARLFLRLHTDFDVLGDQAVSHFFAHRLDGNELGAILGPDQHTLAVQRHAGDFARIDAGDEIRIGNRPGRYRAL